MTITHPLLAEMSDIKAVRLTCKRCKVSMSFPVGQIPTDLSCSHCNQGWFQVGTVDRHAIDELFKSIPVLRQGQDNPAVLVELELDQSTTPR